MAVGRAGKRHSPRGGTKMRSVLVGSLTLLLACAGTKGGSTPPSQACMEECEQTCPGRGGSAGAGDRYYTCLERCEKKCS